MTLHIPEDWTKRDTFTTPFDQYASKEGQSFEIIEQIDPSTYDYDECGEMYIVRLEDGEEIEVWPEEIFDMPGMVGWR